MPLSFNMSYDIYMKICKKDFAARCGKSIYDERKRFVRKMRMKGFSSLFFILYLNGGGEQLGMICVLSLKLHIFYFLRMNMFLTLN